MDISKETERKALLYFSELKSKYQKQRVEYEAEWLDCWRFYYNKDDVSKLYEGYSNIRVPIIDVKVNHILGRTESILFNISRIGRYEVDNSSKANPLIIEAMNRYVFEKQLKDINFKTNYHIFNLQKVILGSSVAKITQDYEIETVKYNDEMEEIEFAKKDNPSFIPLLLNEFYSDITKPCIYESEACIHSTTLPIADVKSNKNYFNTDMIYPDGSISDEMRDYLQNIGISDESLASFANDTVENMKNGMVRIDEYYGKFKLTDNSDPVEVICVIANSGIVIRLEATPFKHKKYVRPFIFGIYKRRLGVLYGESNVAKSIPLVKELNSARSQVSDSRSFSIFPMLYENRTAMTDWDYKWRPMGIIKGNSSTPPITPIVNPNLSNGAVIDISMIQKDLDELWSISPIQQGVSEGRLIPGTASQTFALIAQNDYVLDMVTEEAIQNEFIPFFEMLLERNFTFKKPVEILRMLTPEELKTLRAEDVSDVFSTVYDSSVSICGNTQLSMEQANRQGYERLLQLTQQIPNLARRVDYPKLVNKLLASYGIKDDANDILLPEEAVQEVLQEEMARNEAQLQELAQQAQMLMDENEKLKQKINNKPAEELQMHAIKSQFDLQIETQKMMIETEEQTKRRMSEVMIESQSGKKVN